MPAPGYAGTIEERIERKIFRDGECWIWMGASSSAGHGIIRIDDKNIRVHRILWECAHGPVPLGKELDHFVCHNPACVNPAHLRLASHAQNSRNCVKPRDNTSGYKGVSFFKSRGNWRAYINLNGKRHWLGYFTDPIEAHKAYCVAAIKLHGEFANFGETPCATHSHWVCGLGSRQT